MAEVAPQDEAEKATAEVVAAFGGIRPMAAKLDVPVTTVQGWKKRGAIPAARRETILAAAQEHDVALDSALLDAALGEADAEPGGSASVPQSGAEKTADAAAPERAQTASSGAGVPIGADPPEPDPTPEPAAEPAPQPAPVAAPAKKVGAAAGFVALLALLLVLALIGRDYWVPLVPEEARAILPSILAPGDLPAAADADSAAPDPLDVLREQLAAQAERLDALERVAAERAERLDELDSLSAALAALQQNVDDTVARLEAELDTAAEAVAEAQQAAQSPPSLPADPARTGERLTQLARENDALDARIEALEARPRLQTTVEAIQGALSALDGRVAELALRLADFQETAGAVTALAERSASLSQRLDRLQVELAARDNLAEAVAAAQASLTALRETVADGDGALAERLDGLAARLDRFGERLDAAQESRLREEALMLAVAQLRGQAMTGGDFTDAFRLVERLVGAISGVPAEIPEALETIAPLAGNGAPTRQSLSERFDALSDDIVRAALTGPGASWWEETLYRLASIVSIRPVGERPGQDAAAIVARAERRLADGDLTAALDELAALDGRAAAVTEPWLADAQDRLRLDDGLTRITAFALERLGGEADPAGGRR